MRGRLPLDPDLMPSYARWILFFYGAMVLIAVVAGVFGKGRHLVVQEGKVHVIRDVRAKQAP